MKDKSFKLMAKANLKGQSFTISDVFAISIMPYISDIGGNNEFLRCIGC